MFEFPKIYSFPPFYTKQQNATILQNQLDAWTELILQFCQYYNIYSLLCHGNILTQQDPSTEVPPLFQNKQLERAVLDEFLNDIFNHMIHKLARAEYVDPKKRDSGILIYWQTPAEWAKLLYEYVDRTGQLGTVLTVYELTQLDELPQSEPLKGIDSNLFEKVVDVLVKQGKAQVLRANGGIEGVKIV
ncbi:CIC11C00000001467 [Sungouiella intermedia]|uniref:CIC11C00000001467 n=1 Tax=Sungouiella intermedia TaxID=45354 RepID=A0A1L0BWK6_9ASCO|nr:CIC11C00000001467 [[Candida] intermedia]